MALLKNFSEITTLFTGLHRPHTHSQDSSTSNEVQRTQPGPCDQRSQDTPPIWMDRTLRLYGLIKEFLGNYKQDSTTPTHTLETPRLLMRHNEPNPVHLTIGHKDTPPIWMDRTLRLYGFIKEFLGNYNSFHRTPPPPHTFSRLLDF